MKLRPIKDRILIKPELPASTTESGLILMEHRKPEQTGTVVAVGPCAHPKKQEAEEIAEHLEVVNDYDHERFCAICGQKNDRDHDNLPHCFEPDMFLRKVADFVRDLTRKEPAVKVGDYVVYSWTAGQEIWIEDGDERYLMMTENDILAVVEGLEA